MSNKRLRHVTGVTSGAVSTPAPVLSISPAVTGTATVSSTLSCTTGTWTNTPTSYAYQWLNEGVAISGETSTSYVVQSGDATHQISCQVTAINAGGSASASSNALTIGSLVPANTVAPVISGTVTQGQTLSATTGTWTNSPTGYSYQWKRGVSNIIGATSSTYLLASADVASNITCDVTATNAAGNATATSNSLGPVIPLAPTNSVAPIIAGTASVGATLSVTSNGTWANSPTSYAYQWKRGGVAISGETASSYLLTGTDAAANITCTITASNAGGSASATSNSIGPIASPTITTPTLTQTSSAGASPFLFDASLNTTDTFAGYIFRVQTASGTGGDFTVTTQDISHTLSESDITSGDIDISADGFLTPSGGFSLRARIERDDGVTSSWSNTLTDTIIASVTQWTSTNGTKKSTWMGTPTLGGLRVQGTNSLGAFADIGASIAGATKSQYELTFTTAATSGAGPICFGRYNTTSNLGTLDVRPGVSDSNGYCILAAPGNTTLSIFRSGGTQSDFTLAGGLVAGDVLTDELDVSGAGGSHVLKVYRNGSLIATLSGQTFTGFTTAWLGLKSDEVMTANFGGSAWTHALNSGFAIYG